MGVAAQTTIVWAAPDQFNLPPSHNDFSDAGFETVPDYPAGCRGRFGRFRTCICNQVLGGQAFRPRISLDQM